jgi:hypothetical protein
LNGARRSGKEDAERGNQRQRGKGRYSCSGEVSGAPALISV